jgi:hypothetical protein
MNSLQQSLDSRQSADDPPTTVSITKTAAAGLEVRTSTGEDWAIPWPHFVGARFYRDPDGERIVLSFTEHEITVKGLRLGPLLKEIAGCRIEFLAPLPPNYRLQPKSKSPEVRRVSVELLPDSS